LLNADRLKDISYRKKGKEGRGEKKGLRGVGEEYIIIIII